MGNNRVVADTNGTIVQTNDCYPFGANFAGSTSTDAQPYKYNGKELDTKGGLNLYDYGARHYDPVLGRFMTMDPLAEKCYLISPHVYCANNPVKYIDPDGKDCRIKTHYNENTGKIEYHMSVNAVLYNNSSNQSIDMAKLATAITQQINDVYSISGSGFVSKMDFNMKVVNSIDDIKTTDHVLRVVDQVQLDATHSTKELGAVTADANPFGLDIRISANFTNEIITGINTRTAAHELGHTGGLDDLPKAEEYKDRLMIQAVNANELGVSPNKAIQLPHVILKL